MTQPSDPALSRAAAVAADAADPLAALVAAFALPPGTIYLAGNSLGPPPRAAAAAVQDAVQRQWGEGLVGSWNSAGWFDMPHTLGAKLAGLIGAAADEVVMTDSTGINLFKLVAAAAALRPTRRTIVVEASNFPTNTYVLQGLTRWLGQGYQLRFADGDAIAAAIDDSVAVAALTHVHYRTAARLDMAALNARAAAVGALTVWDLCHSAGVVDVDLNAAGADFATGCTYKYLCGGPGSPAYAFAARRHHGALAQPLTGWWGHRAPFAFERDFAPADGVARLLTGTQPVLAMAAAAPGIDLAVRAGAAAHAKARALAERFAALVAARLPDAGLTLISPENPAARGAHLAYDHAAGRPLMQALIAAGVIGDFRAPATLRFGFAPLHLRHVDIWDAVDRLATIIAAESWRDARFAGGGRVT